MSAHMPYIVVKIGGPINPTGILYRVVDGEDPVYKRVAEGFLSPILDMAKKLNYLEAKKNNELAVVAMVENAVPDKSVGIPTQSHEAVLKIQDAVRRWDSGRIGQAEFVSRVRNAVFVEGLMQS